MVLAGYDDEVAYLSDTGFEELQTTRLENLARGPPRQAPGLPARRPHVHRAGRAPSWATSARPSARAIERNAEQMLEPPLGEYEGLPALRRFAAEVGDWPEQVEDWQWCARFCYQVIERRGTGGGNFRLMYSRFLEEAGSRGAPLAADAAASWTALAEALLAASEADGPEPELWSRIGARGRPRRWTPRSACGRRSPDSGDRLGGRQLGQARKRAK